MSKYIKVASVSDIPDPGKQLVEVDDSLVVLFHVDGKFYALDDVCTHDGGSLGEGVLDGDQISCVRHGAKFNIRDGRALTMPATKATVTYEVKIEGDEVFIKIDDDQVAAATMPDYKKVETATKPINVEVESVAMPVNEEVKTAEMPLNEETVRETLKNVIDPELFVNIVDLGLIYEVRMEAGKEGKTDLQIDMTLTSPMCPAGPQMIAQSKQVLTQLEDVGEVEIKIVLDPPWSPDSMSDDARDQLGIF